MSSEIDRLLDAACELAATADGEDSSKAYWRAVTQLHSKPVQAVFDRCLTWCSSSDPDQRRLGADVLGQLGCADHAYPFRVATRSLLKVLLSDEEASVVVAALIAFGHLGAQESIAEIVLLSQYPAADVRHAVAFALLGEESDLAVATLIELSRDASAEVRDWSTFGLGAQIDTDTTELRDALLARADDPDPSTRAEALSGLVKRRDLRVLVPLVRALESDRVGSMEVEAARDLGAVELLAPLEKLRSWWDVDSALLESAISECAKDRARGAG
jgi:HEAT repeat protein